MISKYFHFPYVGIAENQFVEMDFSTNSLPYYHGELSASAATRRLMAKGAGYWMVRKSDVAPEEYILSYVNRKCVVAHLIIPRNKRNSVIGMFSVFDSLTSSFDLSLLTILFLQFGFNGKFDGVSK